jgi:hypothetical protein
VDEWLGRAARAWVDLLRPYAAYVILVFLAAAAGAVAYAAGHLGLDSDEMALFDRDVPFIQMREAYRRDFPTLLDPIVGRRTRPAASAKGSSRGPICSYPSPSRAAVPSSTSTDCST